MPDYREFDGYEDFEADFDPLNFDRQARRRRRRKAQHHPKKSEAEILNAIAETTGIEGDFETRYKPARHERLWLYDSLKPFYQAALIDDVLSLVKGGKEANVYRCLAHSSVGREFLAAKVYRPRRFRNLRNDRVYREGRQVLSANGRPIKERDVRTFRALGKKSAFGQQVSHTSWLMHEFNALKVLHAAGADVPQPIAAGENAILMDYVGDARLPAPPLHTVNLEAEEARRLFARVIDNIVLMLRAGMIHGDLSEYNILYWAGAVTLIDFPQVVEVRSNHSAETILQRDILRVCQYFNQFGLDADAGALHSRLWDEYGIDHAESAALQDDGL